MQKLINNGAISAGTEFTEKEILNQPRLWIDIYNDIKKISGEINKYIKKAARLNNLQIIFTGAGSSAFIGDTINGIFQKNLGLLSSSIPTTDIITHPELFIRKNNPLLLISFARSGNSPESSKVIELAESISRKVFHLVITCSPESNLLKTLKGLNFYKILLPPEANDQSLAMTSSFSGMLLAGLLLAKTGDIESAEKDVSLLCEYGEKILFNYKDELKNVAEKPFARSVFLGSGSLRGIARESHLKLQELTDGRVICKYDSFLGFRHGPKAVIDEDTLIVYLFSNNSYANKYEIDLVNGIKEGRKTLCSVGFMEKEIKLPELDLKIILSCSRKKLSEDFLPVVSVLPAQVLGFYKSINLGLKPDSPSDSGMIHRVVQGVKIYRYEANNK